MRRNYSLKKQPSVIQYTNALHEGGIDGEQAKRVRSLVDKLPEEKRKVDLGRFDVLDKVFSLKESYKKS